MKGNKGFKRMAGWLAGGFFTGAILAGSFVWLVDPFYHYHGPILDVPVVLDNAVYQTAGAAKNLSYDSAIIGTSMTENTRTNWFDEELGWHTMKLSYSGAHSSDLRAIFGQVDRKEGELRHVVMDINEYQLLQESWMSYVERPEYLYDDKIFNDYKYLFNHDTFLLSVERCMDGLRGVEDNIAEAYTWEDPELFSKEAAQATCRDARAYWMEKRAAEMGAEKVYTCTGSVSDKITNKLKNCQDNMDNILPFIRENSDTQFHVMVPPYSMLYWELELLSGDLEDTIAAYEHAIEQFLTCENVKVYYFQNEYDMITDLDKYRDSTHHAPEYNRYMFECIRDSKNILTVDNYREALTDMYYFAKDFSYEELWEE